LLLVEESGVAAYKMMYYNADGSHGGMCGNGGRCIAVFAHERGIAPARHTFEALDFMYEADIKAEEIKLRMKDPARLKINIPVKLGRRTIKVHFVDTGAPHVVIPIESLSRSPDALRSLNVNDVGRKIRYARKFQPDGTNVNFVRLDNARTVMVRTYERGVEGETLACGTGAVACGIIAHRVWGLESPVQILPQSGKRLEVRFGIVNGSYVETLLVGPASEIFRGTIDV
jgi:diaminopimelate epimerase